MAADETGWSIQWFNDPQEADALECSRLRSMTPQQRLDEMLDLVERFGRVSEIPFVPVIEVIECDLLINHDPGIPGTT